MVKRNGHNKVLFDYKFYRSPLFYVGDKYKLLPEITQRFPPNIKNFIEPFTGGGSVFLNVDAEQYLLNDIDSYVYKLHLFLMKQAKRPNAFFREVEKKIIKYNLSRSYKEDVVPLELKQKWKKTYFARYNKEGFNQLRKDFNTAEKENLIDLYLLLIYGFNRMLRFNSEGSFNLPVGNVDFNNNVIQALKDYFTLVGKKSIKWHNLDYKKFLNSLSINRDDFVYFDPPYLITFSEYNKLWNDEKEEELVELLNELDKSKIKFAVSNVTKYKENNNKIFTDWAEQFNVYPVKSNYISYHDNTIKNFKEVLVTNYA
jgi:DNA adenine methylase